MSYRVSHEWKRGALIAGSRLSTCAHCGALRTEALDGTHYTLRSNEDAGRVRLDEPPCIPPAESTALLSARASAAADRQREERKRAIEALGPDPVDPPEAPPPEPVSSFPWPSNLVGKIA